jgi:hypothetical protein
VLTRVRLLYYAQLIALFALFGCLLGAAVYLVLADPPARPPSGMTPAVTSSKPAEKHMGDDQQHYFTYEADKAVDGIDETAWRVNGDGVGAWIKLSYPEEVSVNQIGIIPRHDKIDPAGFGTDYFALLHVVRRASFEFSDGTTVPKQFTRDRNMQWLQLDPPVTTKSIRIEIQATYPPDKTGRPPGGETAISEIKVR